MADNRDFLDYLGGLETRAPADTEKTTERTRRAVLKRAGLKRGTSGAKKFGRVLLLAAAVTACAAATAAAAGVDIGGLFRGYFEGGGVKQSYGASAAPAALTPSQTEVLNKSGSAPDISVTDNGTTIAVKAVTGDKNNAYILFDVTAPEGTKLDRDDYSFARDDNAGEMEVLQKGGAKPAEHGWSGGWDYTTMKDADPDDNKVQIVMNVNFTGLERKGKEVRLDLKNITVPDKNRKTRYLPVIEGEWKLTVPLDYTSASKELTVNETTHFKAEVDPNAPAEVREQESQRSYECTVNTVSLSSFSALVEFSGESSGEKESFPIPSSLTLHLKDGSQIQVENNGPGVGSTDTMSTSYRFDAPIEVDGVASLTFGDLTIPVS